MNSSEKKENSPPRDEYNPDDLPQLLSFYYQNLFPYKLFYRWLSYGNVIKDYFNRREFSFTLEGDIYIRYLSFNDAEEFHRELVKKNPVKIDIGAVYNIPPKDSKKNELQAFQALERELVFDIDLTDYDDIRRCCDGANICNKCWKFMIIAVKVLNRSLKYDFGFKHLLFVYSGRRGVHCWVADKRARELTFEARASIVEYLTLVTGGNFKDKKVQFRNNLHPSIIDALQIIEPYFDTLITEQGWLDDKPSFDRIMDLCTNMNLKEDLKRLFDSKLKPVDLWKKVEAKCKQFANQQKFNIYFLEEVKIQYAYPRLDINVSKGVNHLLKSPFSVHPKTGRVSVPIDLSLVDNFDPFKVPNINQICRQVDEFDKKNTNSQLENFEKTCIRSSIFRFNQFVNKLVVNNKEVRNQQNDKTLEF